MKQKSESTIEELRSYLTQQLEAYYQNDADRYNQLEKKILSLEKEL